MIWCLAILATPYTNEIFDKNALWNKILKKLTLLLLPVGLQTVTIELDGRVTDLEEGAGNDSIAELEVRVEALEVTAADHTSRLFTREGNVVGE